MLTWLVFTIGAFASVALLSYEIILLIRIFELGARHLASDVIALCYLLSAIGPLAIGATFFSSKGIVPAWRRRAMSVALMASLIWLWLHMGGYYFSHESMFLDR